MTKNEVMILGRELTEHREKEGPVGLPRAAWDTHLLICGETGSGKTTTATRALTSAHATTDGPTIVIDPKGEGWPTELARALYAETGSLDFLLYFPISEFLPAFSIIDIRRELDADTPRQRAVQDLSSHILELIEHVKPGGFDAIRSPDLIEYMIHAALDPVLATPQSRFQTS